MKSIETHYGVIEDNGLLEFELKIYEHEWKGRFFTLRERADHIVRPDQWGPVIEYVIEKYQVTSNEYNYQFFTYDIKDKLWRVGMPCSESSAPFYNVLEEEYQCEPTEYFWPKGSQLPQYEVERRIFGDTLSQSGEAFLKQADTDIEFMKREIPTLEEWEKYYDGADEDAKDFYETEGYPKPYGELLTEESKNFKPYFEYFVSRIEQLKQKLEQRTPTEPQKEERPRLDQALEQIQRETLRRTR